MKKILITLFVLSYVTSDSASIINVKAKYLEESEMLRVTVLHGGGCKDHTFKLDLDNRCLETYPAQCSATLIHTEGMEDPCKAIVKTTFLTEVEPGPYYLSINAEGNENVKTRVFIPQKNQIKDKINFVQNIEVVKVESLCPEGMVCVTDGTVVTLRLTLNGCLDTLGPVSYLSNEDNSNLNLFVSAVNIIDEDSARVMCIRMPTVTKKISLINQFGEVRLNVLKNQIN